MINPVEKKTPNEAAPLLDKSATISNIKLNSEIVEASNSRAYESTNITPRTINQPANYLSDLKISLTPYELVLAGEYKIVKNKSDPIEYLFAFGADDSIIISIRSRKTNNIGLYHVNESKALASNLKKFFKKFGDTRDSDHWEVTMVGGQWLTGSGLGSKIESLLKTEHAIIPKWDKWSFSACSARRYGVLLHVQTTEQTTFEHTRQFTDNVNKDILQQLREKNNKPTARDSHMKTYDFNELIIEKSRSVIEENSFNNIVYQLSATGIKSRERIDQFVHELNKHQGDMLLCTRKEQISKIKEIHQQLNLQDVVGLHIQKSSGILAEDDDSSNTRSTDISQQACNNLRARHVTPHGSHETHSTAISERKGNLNNFEIFSSRIFLNQKETFTDRQHALIEKGIGDLANGRQHKSSHPMISNRFSPSILDKLSDEFPKISFEKFYSRDLADWDGTGSGRGPWRIVSVYSDGKLIIAGVFDNHKNPYQPW